ncbi:predicted protein [Naegleria gruberi]|uniref:Predicted protein n=1 Tax=Naegleria gruberi TaxID=5762 RepID=D2VQV7_NAEGR|nr:uncharacterized protein NAEGRDRAFT_71362 [Naegleria gruberi]EFC40779.1 predicted protein [Naegleria gruberi]|eukprot:XP_002673523.1 predicted protein [Naegleria gruberi strain NEG-M]
MGLDPLNNSHSSSSSSSLTSANNLVVENDDDESLSREINQQANNIPIVYSSTSVDGLTTVTTTTSILNPLGVTFSTSSDTLNQSSSVGEPHQQNFIPPPVGVPINHLVLSNQNGIYVGCENPYATPRNRETEQIVQDEEDPFGTDNIDIPDDEFNSQSTQAPATVIEISSNNQHPPLIIDDVPGVQYGSHHQVTLNDANNISSRVVTTPQKHFSPVSHNDDFHDIDLGGPTPSPSISTQPFFSNPLFPRGSTASDTMSFQQTSSPYSKPDPHASPSANRYRPSLDQPLPDIPTLQGSPSNNENSMFRTVNQPTITIHITEENGDYVSAVEKRFSNAVIISVALFFIGLPFLSCFPFLLLFPYRHSSVARIRSLGHVSVVIFNMLCVLNLVLLLCVSVPIFFVLIVSGIAYSGPYKAEQ